MYRTIYYLSLCLVFFAPLIHIAGEDNPFFTNSRIEIPAYFSTVFSYSLFILYLFSAFLTIVNGRFFPYKEVVKETAPIIFAYCFLFIASISYQSDMARYFLIVIVMLTFPIVINFLLNNYSGYLKAIKDVSLLYVFFSFVFVIVNFFPGLRITGMLGNPNIFSATLLFHLAFLIAYSHGVERIRNLNLIVTVLIIFIFLSGSRSALLCAFFISAPMMYKRKIYFSLIFLACVIFSPLYLDFNFLIDRFSLSAYENIAAESGRSLIWKNALFYINRDIMFGWGMNAPMDLLDTGNIHNSYYRVILMVGAPLAVLFCFFLVLFIINTFRDVNKFSELKVFILSFFLLSIGEDFLVGIGSAMFYYFLLAIPLSMNLASRKKLNRC
jgi:hypothetical protein